jgi:opacity protein-like surface antigen
MRRHIVGSGRRQIGAALLVGGTVAAGAAAAEEAGDWAGWYLGATLDSYAVTLSETEVTLPGGTFSDQYDYSGDGLGFGLMTGRLWQRDAVTYGFEIGVSTGPSAAADINSPDNTYFYDAGLMLALKARVGYVVRPKTHLFASAGLSMGNLDYDWTTAGVPESGRVWSQGYTLGLGVEQRIGDQDALRFGIDYLRRDSDDFSAPTILPGVGYSNEWEQVTVSVGFTHFFGD